MLRVGGHLGLLDRRGWSKLAEAGAFDDRPPASSNWACSERALREFVWTGGCDDDRCLVCPSRRHCNPAGDWWPHRMHRVRASPAISVRAWYVYIYTRTLYAWRATEQAGGEITKDTGESDVGSVVSSSKRPYNTRRRRARVHCMFSCRSTHITLVSWQFSLYN